MQRYKKEACRNFQRGFCQYGDRCKFLHDERQTFPSNQANDSRFPFGSTAQPTQQKPFENKWSRFSSNSSSHHHQQQHLDSKPQAPTNHECGDPESCKNIIAEDFKSERPLWKLTCYGHWKGIPCDITGDISSEELRSVAYDEAKRGLPLRSIVERERNLVNSKLSEYENFLRSRNTSAIPPPSVSSFTQLGATLNLNNQSNPQQKPFGSTFNGGGAAPFRHVMGFDSISSNTRSIFGNQVKNDLKEAPMTDSVPIFPSIPIEITSIREESGIVHDMSVWKKEKWTFGEIPEDAPPDHVITA